MKLFHRLAAALLLACASFSAQPAEFRQISQVIDSSGNPVVNGYIYIGTYGLDPVTNPISLFSDSALSVPIANPQRTDSYGRPVNDIYFAESQYSYTLKTSASVTIEGPEDRNAIATAASVASNQAGTATSCGTLAGTNTLTCTLSPAITAYTDLMTIRGRVANDNTGAVTLNVNGLGAKNVVKNDGEALAAGDLQQNDTATFVYDSTNNRFQLNSGNGAVQTNGAQTITGAKTMSGAAFNTAARVDVASAATVNLDTATSNYVRITGTTTTTAITLSDGRSRTLVAAAAWPITAGASLILPGTSSGTTVTLAAGDTLEVLGESGGVVRVVSYTRATGGRDGLCLTNSISANANADIVLPAGFQYYEVRFDATVSAEPNSLLTRISQDGGSTFKSGGTDYEYAGTRNASDGSAVALSSSTGGPFIGAMPTITGSAAGENMSGRVFIADPASTTKYKIFNFQAGSWDNAATSLLQNIVGTGSYNADTNAINAVRFYVASGTMTGTFKLYCYQ